MIAVKRLIFWPLFLGLVITFLLDMCATDGNRFTLLRNWSLATVEVFVLMWSIITRGWVARILFALSAGVVSYLRVNNASNSRSQRGSGQSERLWCAWFARPFGN